MSVCLRVCVSVCLCVCVACGWVDEGLGGWVGASLSLSSFSSSALSASFFLVDLTWDGSVVLLL